MTGLSPGAPSLGDWQALLGEPVCERIGRYKVLQKIGEGGCGVVYMAEQEEPVRRRVALKVIKLGMDTKSVIARFEAERQALALMDHPNIAKVLDADTTESGRPYFVMELVRGIPITAYCDQNDLSIAERLALFTQVCQAIQHAHQKGIIHRDVKPSNILVTLHDGVPAPKVIDFGIAKATTGQRLTEKTLFTALEQFIGTPAYMSPEQAEMSGLDIDTRTDIYSLGVLLYELLTGKTPFEPADLFKAGFDGMRRLIREQEPARPSMRLITFSGAELQTIAKQRRSEAPKLLSLVRGDLDWIVMKALDKDRTRRYESASAFAQDVEHHLRHEPVIAAAPSALYKFRKFARRNRGALSATVLLVVGLVIATTTSLWLTVRARRAETTATMEAVKSRQVAMFLKEMLRGVRPWVASGRDTTLLREIVDKTADRVTKDLHDQSDVEAELENTLGDVYLQIGDRTKAESMARSALTIREKLFGHEHVTVAQSLLVLAGSIAEQGKLAEADLMMRDALTIQERLVGIDNREVAFTLDSLAWLLVREGKFDEAEQINRLALAIRRKLLDTDSIAMSLGNLADILFRQGKLDEAESLHREALAMQKKAFGDEHPSVARSLLGLGLVLRRQRKWAEAEAVQRESVTLARKALRNDDPQLINAVCALAMTLRFRRNWPEAESAAQECLTSNEKRYPDAFETFDARAQLGLVQLGQSHYPEAEELLLSGYDGMIRRQDRATSPLLGKGHLQETITGIVSLYESTARPEKAAEWKQILTQVH
jgi:tetratricopeptide (TPR) repeat protein